MSTLVAYHMKQQISWKLNFFPFRNQLKVEGKKPLTIKVCAGSTRKGSAFKGKFLWSLVPTYIQDLLFLSYAGQDTDK